MAAVRPRERVTAVAGCLLVGVALVIIWVARLSVPRPIYVSGLGADGAPTARWFEVALLLIVVGGSSIAYAGRGIRSRVAVLRAWTPAVSLWVACAFFLVDSQVTCTAGCPVPLGEAFTWQDFVHTLCAVLAFGWAVWAMLQSSFAHGHRVLVVFSRSMAIAVLFISSAGGLMSVFAWRTDIGSAFELVATTLGIGWVIVYGLVIAA